MFKKTLYGSLLAASLGMIVLACAPRQSRTLTPAPAGALLLDGAASSLTATAIKNETIPVAVAFPKLTGWVSLAPALKGELSIDIAALTTGNPGRDQNIAELFFETLKSTSNQSALFRMRGVKDGAFSLKDGEEGSVDVSGTLSLHGGSVVLSGPLLVKRVGAAYTATLGVGWKLNIPTAGMSAALANLNKLCPQPHRVGEDVALAGRLNFGPKP